MPKHAKEKFLLFLAKHSVPRIIAENRKAKKEAEVK
jgi:hypothetical protein